MLLLFFFLLLGCECTYHGFGTCVVNVHMTGAGFPKLGPFGLVYTQRPEVKCFHVLRIESMSNRDLESASL